MKIWIDNTGLESAGQCLDGQARQDCDVRGLLQLATLIIYGNKISVNGFEDIKVATRSEQIVNQLRTIGITDDILTISPVNEVEYALACKTAADLIAPELCDTFNPIEFDVIGGVLPDVLRGLRERQVAFVTLAKEKDGSEKLQEVEESALKDKAIGAAEYMLACSPALREAVARLFAMHMQWGDRYSYQLNVFLRYHLNHALAEQSFSIYAPAIARAELVTQRSQYVLEALENIVDKTVADLRGEPLGVPSTLAALLQRSKGEPRAVLSEARALREKSKPLRDMLDTLIATYHADTPASRFEIRKKINELGQQMRRDVELEKNAKIRDAVEVRFVIGVPVPCLSGKELLKWVQERALSRRTAILTELVMASAYSDFSSKLYEKLRKRSSSS